jgi:hypothetical protein
VEDERVHIGAKLSDKERDAMGYQAGDEVNVTAEPVQLGHSHRAALAAGVTESGGKLRSAIQGVRTLARFDLYEHANKLKAFRGRKARKRFPLRLNAQTGAALSRSRDPYVSNERSRGHNLGLSPKAGRQRISAFRPRCTRASVDLGDIV